MIYKELIAIKIISIIMMIIKNITTIIIIVKGIQISLTNMKNIRIDENTAKKILWIISQIIGQRSKAGKMNKRVSPKISRSFKIRTEIGKEIRISNQNKERSSKRRNLDRRINICLMNNELK